MRYFLGRQNSQWETVKQHLYIYLNIFLEVEENIQKKRIIYFDEWLWNIFFNRIAWTYEL